jgi:hypothetical protein
VSTDLPPDDLLATRAALALFTDAEARAIWARAAQLPAVSAPAGMFFGRDIVAAAQEAGIDSAHVAVALAEHEAVEYETAVVPSDAQGARFVRELGSDAGSLPSGTVAFSVAAGAISGVGLVAGIRRIMRWEHGASRRALERGLQGMLRAAGEQTGPALPGPTDLPTAQAEPPRSLA